MALIRKQDYDALEILASAARTAATGSGDAYRLASMPNAMCFIMDVTVDEQTAADKLDVYVQTKLDGTNWADVVHFTQHDGNVGAARYYAKVVANAALTEFENGTGLGEAANRALLGDEWRVRWAITDDSGNASFTYAVQSCPM